MKPDTIFETEAWGRFVEKRYGYPYTPLRLTLRSGQSVTIPASRLEQRLGLWGVYRAMPPDLFGNVQTEAPLTLPVLREVFTRLNWRPGLHSLTIAFHPLHPAAPAVAELPTRYVLSGQGATRVLPLTEPFEGLWEHVFCKQHRRKIRTATKHGLHVSLNNSDASIEAYYPLYVTSCRRLALPTTEPIEFFYDLKHYLAPHFALLLARAGDQAVAGLIVLTCENRVFAYQISSDERYWDDFPNHLLFSTAIEQACADGADYIDFLPTGDHQGPETFKERFGAQRLPYRIYRIYNQLYATGVGVKNRLARVEHLPMAEAAPVAPAVSTAELPVTEEG